METKRTSIKDQRGQPIRGSKALLWGNNAAWLCTDCGELLGNRTGDNDYQVECTKTHCAAKYEIVRSKNRNGELNLGPAQGVRKIR